MRSLHRRCGCEVPKSYHSPAKALLLDDMLAVVRVLAGRQRFFMKMPCCGSGVCCGQYDSCEVARMHLPDVLSVIWWHMVYVFALHLVHPIGIAHLCKACACHGNWCYCSHLKYIWGRKAAAPIIGHSLPQAQGYQQQSGPRSTLGRHTQPMATYWTQQTSSSINTLLYAANRAYGRLTVHTDANGT